MLVDDRLRGLKLRVPQAGLRIKLIPSNEERDACHGFGRDIGNFVLGTQLERIIDMSGLLAS